MAPSQLHRQLRRLKFELAAAQNRLAWTGDDWEQEAALEEVRAARDRLLDAWSLRQDWVRADAYGSNRPRVPGRSDSPN